LEEIKSKSSMENAEENGKNEPAGELEDVLAGELDLGSDNEKDEQKPENGLDKDSTPHEEDKEVKGGVEEEVAVERNSARGEREKSKSRENTPKKSARREEEELKPIPTSPPKSARRSPREGTPKKSARREEEEKVEKIEKEEKEEKEERNGSRAGSRGGARESPREGTPKKSARREEEEEKEVKVERSGSKSGSRGGTRDSARSKHLDDEHSEDEK
jgi:hypothetical protein